MPTTIAHSASASLIAVTFAGVEPQQTPYIAAAWLAASVIDLDHAYYVLKDRAMYRERGFKGQLHHARSVFHELFGLLAAGLIAAALFAFDQQLARVVFIAVAVHLVQDWIVGTSHPLAPLDRTVVRFFTLSFTHKVFIDIMLLTVSGILWITL